jgi:O-antigen ligase
MIVIDRKISVRPALINWPALVFIGMAILSFIWSSLFVDHQVGFLYNDKFLPRLMTIDVMIISPLTTLLFANYLRSERAFKWIVWWLVAVGSIFWIRYFFSWSDLNFINTGGQFSAIVCALALGQLLFNPRQRWYVRLVLLGTVGIWMYIQIQLGLSWLSGWLPVVLAVGLVTVAYSRKLAVLFALVGIAYLLSTGEVFSSNLERENLESGVTRTAAWEQTLDIVRDHLFLGTGPAGYHYYLTAYGTFRSGIAQLSHNNYIDVIAQTGMVGFLGYLSFWIGVGLMAWKLLRAPMPSDLLRGLKYAALACYPVTLLSMMLGDWVIPFPYTQTLAGVDYTIWHWMMAGIIIALYYFGSDQARQMVPARAPERAVEQ